MTIDERIEAIAMNLELASRNIHELQEAMVKTNQQILALLALAGLHQQRLDKLDPQEGV